MFEDGAIVDQFIQAWRKSGKQVSPLCFITMATYHISDVTMATYHVSDVTMATCHVSDVTIP